MQTNHHGIILPAPSVAKRNIPAASSAHCTAFCVLGDGHGLRTQAESWLELCNLFLLNAKENVMELAEQEEFRYGDDPDDQAVHYFDVIATLTCGRRIAYTVKPEVRLNSRSGKRDENGERLDDRTFLEKMSNITWWATVETETYDEVRLVTEADINQTDLRNARMFAAVRESDAEADASALAVAMGLPAQGGRSLRDLTIETGMQARGYRALIRLMRRGLLRPIAHEVIRPLTVVRFSPRP
jgi:hypothetical protein